MLAYSPGLLVSIVQAFTTLVKALKISGDSSSSVKAAAVLEVQVQELFTVAQLAMWSLLGRALSLAPTDRARLQQSVEEELAKYGELQQALVVFAKRGDPRGYEAAADVLALVVAAVKRAYPDKPKQTMQNLSEIFAAAVRAKKIFDMVDSAPFIN